MSGSTDARPLAGALIIGLQTVKSTDKSMQSQVFVKHMTSTSDPHFYSPAESYGLGVLGLVTDC